MSHNPYPGAREKFLRRYYFAKTMATPVLEAADEYEVMDFIGWSKFEDDVLVHLGPMEYLEQRN